MFLNQKTAGRAIFPRSAPKLEAQALIISDKHKFIFVHIPKCGGTTVRSAFSALDERKFRYQEKYRSVHGEIGELDYHHIPLSFIKEYFYEDFILFNKYRSYAITRNPKNRFVSAVLYHNRELFGAPHGIMNVDLFIQESEKIISMITEAGDAPILPASIIHFSRQCEYVFLDGLQIVQNTYKIENISDMIIDLENQTGQRISAPSENYSFHYNLGFIRRLDTVFREGIMNHIPRNIWKPIFSISKFIMLKSGIIERPDHASLFDSLTEQCKEFVYEYYKDDFSLYESSI